MNATSHTSRIGALYSGVSLFLRLWGCAILCFAALVNLSSRAGAQLSSPIGPTLSFSGGFYLPDNTLVPNLFTWTSRIEIHGSGWGAGATIGVHIVGPLNLPGVTPHDRYLGNVFTDSSGSISPGLDYDPNVQIPYNAGTATAPDVPRPGNYRVYAIRSHPSNPPTVFDQANAADHLNLCPRTIPFVFPNLYNIFWSEFRGGRDGQLGDNSPERTDPEWVSVWDETPVAIYATVAESDLNGGNQPAFISHADYPRSHFGHDLDLIILPDPDYRWILGDANFNSPPGSVSRGRIELEWETQNNGRPFVGSYGTGNIGVPLWASPAAGDRIFTVGRWAMDNGHPDSGDRTEIHPPRMIAAMRKRSTVVPFSTTGAMTRASQVDIYVSGHGGGANRFPDSLSQALNNGGVGGGNINNVLSERGLIFYFAYGPADSFTANLVTSLLGGDTSQLRSVAGPSAFGWLDGPEERPVNDMDYDFDVPLPPAPAGATAPVVKAITHSEHTTSVAETITYTTPDPTTGLPTKAHIHLPYRGADSLIYARTLKFSWNVFSAPGKHFVVTMNSMKYFLNTYMSGKAYMWAEVCGQMAFLTGLNPTGFLNTQQTLNASVPNLKFDVYLDPTDSLRVFTFGYDQEDLDGLFGVDVGKSAYDAAIDVGEAVASAKVRTLNAGDGDNVDLGGALFQFPANATGGLLGNHTVLSNPFFYTSNFTVDYVPVPPSIAVSGTSFDFGQVCLGSTGYQDILVSNRGEAPLQISAITVTGGGFSEVPGLPLPFSIAGGAAIDVNAYFTPKDITQGTGTITFQTNDPLHPSVSYSLTGTVGHSTLQATANTARTPSLVVGSGTRWNVTISNPGTCVLHVKPSIAGAGFSILLPSSYYNPFNGALLKDVVVAPGGANQDLTVQFVTPSVGTKFVGTLALASNDPLHPTGTLTFGAEGVPVGMRVLVIGADGKPCPLVNEIRLKYDAAPGSRVHRKNVWFLKSVPLTTIDPPSSWKRIQYHTTQALEPTAGNDTYQLQVRVGNKTQRVTFTLGAEEFKQIVITLP